MKPSASSHYSLSIIGWIRLIPIKIRWIIFIPVYMGAIYIIMYLFGMSLKFLFSFIGVFYTLIIMLLLFFIFWYTFRFVEEFMSLIIIRICPHYMTGAIIFTIFILINNIWDMLNFWNVVRFEKDFSTFTSIIYSVIILIITYFLITGAFANARAFPRYKYTKQF